MSTTTRSRASTIGYESSSSHQREARCSTSQFEQADVIIPFSSLKKAKIFSDTPSGNHDSLQRAILSSDLLSSISLEVLKNQKTPESEYDLQNYSTLLVFNFRDPIQVHDANGGVQKYSRAALRVSFTSSYNPDKNPRYPEYSEPLRGIELDFVMDQEGHRDTEDVIVVTFPFVYGIKLNDVIEGMSISQFPDFLFQQVGGRWCGRRDFYTQIFITLIEAQVLANPSASGPNDFKSFFDAICEHGKVARGKFSPVISEVNQAGEIISQRFGPDFLNRREDTTMYGTTGSVYE
ncbi:hypothetical protein F5B20DRAFT_595926 [Whalleya microplaca]|nr:hypothetical protein F5B20DRAFT_595926 [Whalleya microplaca]